MDNHLYIRSLHGLKLNAQFPLTGQLNIKPCHLFSFPDLLPAGPPPPVMPAEGTGSILLSILED